MGRRLGPGRRTKRVRGRSQGPSQRRRASRDPRRWLSCGPGRWLSCGPGRCCWLGWCRRRRWGLATFDKPAGHQTGPPSAGFPRTPAAPTMLTGGAVSGTFVSSSGWGQRPTAVPEATAAAGRTRSPTSPHVDGTNRDPTSPCMDGTTRPAGPARAFGTTRVSGMRPWRRGPPGGRRRCRPVGRSSGVGPGAEDTDAGGGVDGFELGQNRGV
jgi:hypothetical protein